MRKKQKQRDEVQVYLDESFKDEKHLDRWKDHWRKCGCGCGGCHLTISGGKECVQMCKDEEAQG